MGQETEWKRCTLTVGNVSLRDQGGMKRDEGGSQRSHRNDRFRAQMFFCGRRLWAALRFFGFEIWSCARKVPGGSQAYKGAEPLAPHLRLSLLESAVADFPHPPPAHSNWGTLQPQIL